MLISVLIDLIKAIYNDVTDKEAQDVCEIVSDDSFTDEEASLVLKYARIIFS